MRADQRDGGPRGHGSPRQAMAEAVAAAIAATPITASAVDHLMTRSAPLIAHRQK